MRMPIHVTQDSTLRVKIIDACGLTCTFCHNEGNPVAADNRGRVGRFASAGPSGRSSIYVRSNGASFLPAPMPADQNFRSVLDVLRARMGFTELHLTGGEPTLHPQVDRLTAIGVEVQGTRYRSTSLAERKISALRSSIATCVALGMRASANIVVVDHTHIPRVKRLLDEYSPELSIRLLNSLEHGTASLSAIASLLVDLDAVALAQHVVAGASGARTTYRLRNGRHIVVKLIRPVRLPTTCHGCPFNNSVNCQEGFYGVRLYYDQEGHYQIGVCIQRMDLCRPLDDFLAGPLPGEILALRETELRRLRTQPVR